MSLVTVETRLEDCLKDYPETLEVFARYGLHCADCLKDGIDCALNIDQIGQRCEWYGINVEEILEEINRVISLARGNQRG